MWMRLRQIAVVASDLQKVGAEITGVLGAEACFTDPGVKQFGLKNTLWPIGTQMLEVVTPITDGTAGGRYIERRGGDGGYMVITQVDDVALGAEPVPPNSACGSHLTCTTPTKATTAFSFTPATLVVRSSRWTR